MSIEDLEKVLEAAHLSTQEEATFLERLGKQYIQRFPQSSILLDYIRHYLQDFNVKNMRISSSHRFFLFLTGFFKQLPEDIQSYIQNWDKIISFIGRPTTNKAQLTDLAAALSALHLYRLSSPYSSSPVLKELAQAFATCVEDEIDLIGVIYALSPALGRHTLYLFYSMAKSVGEVSNTSRRETLFIPYIRVTLELEAEVVYQNEEVQDVHKSPIQSDWLYPSPSDENIKSEG